MIFHSKPKVSVSSKKWWEFSKMWRPNHHQFNIFLRRMHFNRQIGIWAEFRKDNYSSHSQGWNAWFELNLWKAQFSIKVLW